MKNERYISLIDFERLPFFYGLLNEDEINASHVPRFMPFKWGVDLHNNLFRQFPSVKNAESIKTAYASNATIAPPTGEGKFGNQWVVEIFNALLLFHHETIKGKRVLEIGCSNGLLLSKFSSLGAECVGIEPGPQAQMCAQRDLIKIHQCYFESFETIDTFDFVYAINLLEHIEHIDLFFEKLSQVLNPGGLFVAAVPDSSLDMEALSPNIFVHEHYLYFNPEMAVSFLEGRGFRDVRTRKSECGSNFFVCGRFVGLDHNPVDTVKKQRGNEVLISEGIAFVEKLTLFLKNLQDRIDKASQIPSKTLGLYGASNAINFLGLLDWRVAPIILDSDSYNHGKYLWSGRHAKLPVEDPNYRNLESLDEIWVLPIAHQATIVEYLMQLGVAKHKIFKIIDLRNS